LDLCVSLYIPVPCLVFFVLCFCVFVVGCVFSALNKNIMRFKCWDEGVIYPFFTYFCEFFLFLYCFLGFGVACAFSIGF